MDGRSIENIAPVLVISKIVSGMLYNVQLMQQKPNSPAQCHLNAYVIGVKAKVTTQVATYHARQLWLNIGWHPCVAGCIVSH